MVSLHIAGACFLESAPQSSSSRDDTHSYCDHVSHESDSTFWNALLFHCFLFSRLLVLFRPLCHEIDVLWSIVKRGVFFGPQTFKVACYFVSLLVILVLSFLILIFPAFPSAVPEVFMS